VNKGQTNNPNGRPKGIPNKATTQFKERLNDLLEHAAPYMVKWLDDIAADNPEKAFDILSKFAEYVHPKLARTETRHEGDMGVTVTWALPKTKLDE
jgi:hypothetical protein